MGGNLIGQIKSQYTELMEKQRLKLNVVGIASSHKAIFDHNGIDLDNYQALLKESAESDTQKLKNEIISMNTFNSVFVDCTAIANIGHDKGLV